MVRALFNAGGGFVPGGMVTRDIEGMAMEKMGDEAALDVGLEDEIVCVEETAGERVASGKSASKLDKVIYDALISEP
ncbi:hypothetical protein ColTof4_09385 [Colletotrichum tofieldiae]|nr:hypothetical protein ColTof3_12674 [Colletotrichum tofieldiae]GKT76962.1 hypothetical protein ColTof4_09385 [Colletotrichum tofieldiae]GKT92590.1 hypothetical protein Ct61P_10440 [Colletotrichum tofieldiae]